MASLGVLGWAPIWVAAQELWLPSGQKAPTQSFCSLLGGVEMVLNTARHVHASEMATTYLALSLAPDSTFVLLKHNAGGILPSAVP